MFKSEDLFGRLFKSAGPGNSPFSGNTSPLITNAFPNESALPDVVFFDKSAADIIADKFRNAKNNSIAGIQIVEDPDCDCDLYEKVYPVVYPVIKSGGVNQMKLTKLTVLVSSNSAKLAICYAACSRIESGEAVLFYDTTQNELKAKIGKDAEASIKAILKYANLQSPAIPKQMGSQQSTVLDFIRKKAHKASAVILDILIQTLGYLICLAGLPIKIIGLLCEFIGNGIIEWLTFGEEFWNSEHPEYIFKKMVDGTVDSLPSKESLIKILSVNENALDGLKIEIQQTLAKPEFSYITSLFKSNIVERVFNSLRNFVRKINTKTKTLVDKIYQSDLSGDDLKKVVSGMVAYEVGMLNGLIDFVGGLFLFIAFAGNSPFDFWVSVSLDVVIQLFDKTVKLVEEVTNGELREALGNSLDKFREDINKLDIADLNSDKIVYGLGFIAAFIATLFIPFTQEAKLRNLKKVLNILPEGILEQAASAVGAAEILAGKVKNKAIALLDDIINFVNKSYTELKKFFDDLFAKIKEWLLKATNNAANLGNDLLTFINKPLSQKLDEIANIWNTKYPIQEMFEGRSFFEDVMGYYRYTKKSGWFHTKDISEFFKGVDFYKGKTLGTNIFAETAVSMKTTITTNVDKWLASGPIKKNIELLEQGWKNTNGLESNGMKMFFNNAEIHVYMPKANITEALKTTWMNKLNTVNPKIKFEIKALENFIQ